MTGFLDSMAESSRARVREAMAREPLAVLRTRALEVPPAPPLRHDHVFDLIAEFKLRSPSLGPLGGSGDEVAAQVTAYATAGAAAVSVLTEPTRFGGRLEHLAAAAAVLRPIGVPAMRKDFLVDPWQLVEARAAGAGGALLILRMLSREQLDEMLDCARELGLFVLVEAFDAGDVEAFPSWAGPREWGPAARRQPQPTEKKGNHPAAPHPPAHRRHRTPSSRRRQLPRPADARGAAGAVRRAGAAPAARAGACR